MFVCTMDHILLEVEYRWKYGDSAVSEVPFMIDVSDRQTWRSRWDRVGPVLEKLKNDELRRMTRK
jgi:hypothetical protein